MDTIAYYAIMIDCFIPANITDLAQNKTAIQSSDWSSYYVAGNAVDGNYGTFSYTTVTGNRPYWSVDLGMSTYVDHLYITSPRGQNGKLFFLHIEDKIATTL